MEEELEFLLKDENILEAEISDVLDYDGKYTTGISLTVGHSEKYIEKKMSEYKEGDEKPQFYQFEILLTKKDINKIAKLIREY